MNPRDLLLSTDYPLDKVIFLGTHQVTLGSFDIQTVTPNHNLGFTPLLSGQWSLTSDFSVAYGINAGPAIGMGRSFDTSIAANNTNLWIETQNRTESTATVYYRLFGFVPSNVNPTAAFTAIQSDPYVINTDYNYMKLLRADSVNIADNGTYTYNHNLGYYPKVMVWNYNAYANGIMPTFVNDADAGALTRVTITTNSLIITHTIGSTNNFHYRIYADEA